MSTPVIQTKRLLIKSYDEAYLPEMFLYRSDPEIYQYQGIKTTDYEEFKRIFARAKLFDVSGNWFTYLIILDNQLIGDIGLNFSGHNNMKVQIGYTIKRDQQKKGYGKEAVRAVADYVFKIMKRHKIIAEVDPENIPSIKLLESVGFVREGIFRKDYYDNGSWVDNATYAILKEDWVR